LLRASLELRNVEQALQGNSGGGRGTSTAGVASSVGGRRREEEADEGLVMLVVLSEGTPEADEASSFPSMAFFWVTGAGAGAALGCALQARNENLGIPPRIKRRWGAKERGRQKQKALLGGPCAARPPDNFRPMAGALWLTQATGAL
jgi:hypothetical protein